MNCPNCGRETEAEYCSLFCFENLDEKMSVLNKVACAFEAAAGFRGVKTRVSVDPARGAVRADLLWSGSPRSIVFTLADLNVKTTP